MKYGLFAVLGIILIIVLFWYFDIAPRLRVLQEIALKSKHDESAAVTLEKKQRFAKEQHRAQALWLKRHQQPLKMLRQSESLGYEQAVLLRILSRRKLQVMSMKLGPQKAFLSWKRRSLLLSAEGSLASVTAVLAQYSHLPIAAFLAGLTLHRVASGVKMVMQLEMVYLHEM